MTTPLGRSFERTLKSWAPEIHADGGAFGLMLMSAQNDSSIFKSSKPTPIMDAMVTETTIIGSTLFLTILSTIDNVAFGRTPESNPHPTDGSTHPPGAKRVRVHGRQRT